MNENEMHQAAYVRSLLAARRAERTVQSYIETLKLLADFHDDADVTTLTAGEIEEFMIDQSARHRGSTAGLRFRNLRAFYNWCVREEIIDKSPMLRMIEPKATDEPPPVLPDTDLKALLAACGGREFEDRRDTAIIRLWCEPGSPRLAEMAGLRLVDLDMRASTARVHGKRDKIRVIPFGPKTGQALDRYLRVRTKHRLCRLPDLWFGGRGTALTPSGLYQMLDRRSDQAGIGHIHPHQLRHTAAHAWAVAGQSDGDAMALFGWTDPAMPRRYGRSAQVERAHQAARRTNLGDRL